MSKSSIDKAARLIRKIYSMPGGQGGGPLHIVIDDGNVEEHHIRWCLEQLNDPLYKWPDELKSACVELAKLMLTMTERECINALRESVKPDGRR